MRRILCALGLAGALVLGTAAPTFAAPATHHSSSCGHRGGRHHTGHVHGTGPWKKSCPPTHQPPTPNPIPNPNPNPCAVHPGNPRAATPTFWVCPEPMQAA
jgi:hypothetical protein